MKGAQSPEPLTDRLEADELPDHPDDVRSRSDFLSYRFTGLQNCRKPSPIALQSVRQHCPDLVDMQRITADLAPPVTSYD